MGYSWFLITTEGTQMMNNNSRLPMARYIKKSTFKDHFHSFVGSAVMIVTWSYCIYLADKLSFYA